MPSRTVLERLTAILCVTAALLGSAPFTPAPLALAVLVPLAAVLARRGSAVSAAISAASVPIAVVLSPIRLEQLLRQPVIYWLLWVLGAAVTTVAVVVNRRSSPRTRTQ